MVRTVATSCAFGAMARDYMYTVNSCSVYCSYSDLTLA